MNQLRKIEGFPGYLVGKDGSVWSKRKRKGVTGRRGVVGFIGTKLMRLKPSRRDHSKRHYLTVGLRNEAGKFISKSVHGLVLLTFSGPCPEGMQCRHLNGNRYDNRLSNLKWGTPLENARDSLKHGTTKRGESINTAKLTDAKVTLMRTLRGVENSTFKELAKKFGVSRGAVKKIIRGRSWSHLPLQDDKMNNRIKLDESKVRRIRKMYNSGNYTYKMISEAFGIDISHVGNVVNKLAWREVE